jgi:hypothetical protein
LYHFDGNTNNLYNRETGWRQTRSTTSYKLAKTETSPLNSPTGVPTSVVALSINRINKLQEGQAYQWRHQAPYRSENISQPGAGTGCGKILMIAKQPKRTPHGLWIAEGLKAGTLMRTTDGSYHRKQVADLSGVGWIIFCKKTGLWLTGSFWEKSPTASSFHAEMLPLCSLCLLVHAIAEYHNVKTWSAVMPCNNKWALEL